MEAITYEELMKVNGGMNRRGHGSGGHSGFGEYNRYRRNKTWQALRSHGKAAVKGARWAYTVITGGKTFGIW